MRECPLLTASQSCAQLTCRIEVAGQLAGLTGKMTINIADGKHCYGFDYTLLVECLTRQSYAWGFSSNTSATSLF